MFLLNQSSWPESIKDQLRQGVGEVLMWLSQRLALPIELVGWGVAIVGLVSLVGVGVLLKLLVRAKQRRVRVVAPSMTGQELDRMLSLAKAFADYREYSQALVWLDEVKASGSAKHARLAESLRITWMRQAEASEPEK